MERVLGSIVRGDLRTAAALASWESESVSESRIRENGMDGMVLCVVSKAISKFVYGKVGKIMYVFKEASAMFCRRRLMVMSTVDGYSIYFGVLHKNERKTSFRKEIIAIFCFENCLK